MKDITTEEILNKLNNYKGKNIWQDVIKNLTNHDVSEFPNPTDEFKTDDGRTFSFVIEEMRWKLIKDENIIYTYQEYEEVPKVTRILGLQITLRNHVQEKYNDDIENIPTNERGYTDDEWEKMHQDNKARLKKEVETATLEELRILAGGMYGDPDRVYFISNGCYFEALGKQRY